MHLAVFVNPTGHHQAAWLHPDSEPDAGISFDHHVRLAHAAERACLDAVFYADNQAVRLGNPGAVSRVAQYVANFEPITLISALSAVTSRIGFISTASTTYNFPYQLARKFASIDHISGGRVGWNIVTSGMPQEAPNFGRLEHPPRELRYERAAEFVEVCMGLWDSWEDDAFPRNRETGQFLDLEAMHTLNHEGRFLSVRGPLNVPRSPQGYPLLVQAGASAEGTAFAARYAEMVFVTPQSLESGRSRYRELKEIAARQGRDPSTIKIMPGLAAIVRETRAEADEEFERLQALLHPDVAINTLAMKVAFTTGRSPADVDLTGFASDEPLPLSDPGTGESFGHWAQFGQDQGLALSELAREASGSLAGLSVHGSGEEIADLMEEWFRGEAADGFNLQPPILPGGLDDFIRHVLPHLRRRGLFRTEYTGQTLRDHLGVGRPEWRSHGSPLTAAE
jgi:FMN-dependent oxidoreductase (nitrilotriacetate monooxygenase family)